MSKKTFTLGIFGGGQLGKFLVKSAKKLNIKTFIYTDSLTLLLSIIAMILLSQVMKIKKN